MPPHRNTATLARTETLVVPPACGIPELETLAELGGQALPTGVVPRQDAGSAVNVDQILPLANRKLQAGRVAARHSIEAATTPVVDPPQPTPEIIAAGKRSAATAAGRTALAGPTLQPAAPPRQSRAKPTRDSAKKPHVAPDNPEPDPESLRSAEQIGNAAHEEAAGQERAVTVDDFTDIFTQYQARIINFIYRMVKNRDEAYDLSQDVFVKAYRALDGGTTIQAGALSAWLYRIANNTTLDALRRRRLISWLPLSLFNEDRGVGAGIPEGPIDDSGSEEARGTNATMLVGALNTYDGGLFEDLIANQDIIERVFGKLGEKYSSALWLYEHVGLSVREVADALNSTDSAIKMRLKRARELFIRIYKQEIGNDPGQVFTRRRGGRRLGQIALVAATL